MHFSASNISTTPKSLTAWSSFISFFLIHEKQSTFYQYLLFCISELQYIAILLWILSSLSSTSDHNELSRFILKAVRIITFEGFWTDNTSKILDLSLVIIWLYIGFCCLLIGFLWIKVYKKTSLGRRSRKALSIIFRLHFKLFFWICNVLLMASISDKSQGYKMFSRISAQHKAFVIGQLFAILINYCIGVITSILCFHLYSSNNLFACQDSRFQFLSFLLKAIIAPLAAFSASYTASFSTISILITFAMSVIRIIYLVYEFPFYSYIPMRLAVVFSSVALWISTLSIIALVSVNDRNISQISPSLLAIIPLPLIIKLSLTCLAWIVQSYMTAQSQALQTKQQVTKKFFSYRLLFEKTQLILNSNTQSNRHEIYFLGELISHSHTCLQTSCFCNFVLNKKNNREEFTILKAKKSLENYFQISQREFLFDKIKTVRDNDELKLAFSYMMLEEPTKNLSAALTYMHSTPDDNISYFFRIKKQVLAQKIQATMGDSFNQATDEKLNILKFVNQQTFTSNFKQKIANATKQFISFWETYNSQNPKIITMVQKSNEIEHLADQIDCLWNKYLEMYNLNCSTMNHIYRLYLTLVRNLPSMSQKLARHLLNKREVTNNNVDNTDKITENDLFLPNTLTFHISMARERLGKILNVSDNIQPLLGYHPRTTVGLNLKSLLPQSFAERHDELLLRHLEVSTTSKWQDHYSFNGFMKTKQGYAVPCLTYISVFPYIQKELVYIELVKIFKTNFDYIVLDTIGFIDSSTSRICIKLGLDCNTRNHISEICMDAERLNESFVLEDENLKKTATGHPHDQKPSRRVRQILSNGMNIINIKEQKNARKIRISLHRLGNRNYTIQCKTKLIQRKMLDTIFYVLEIEKEQGLDNKDSARTSRVKETLIDMKKRGSNYDVPDERCLSITQRHTQDFDNINIRDSSRMFINRETNKSQCSSKRRPDIEKQTEERTNTVLPSIIKIEQSFSQESSEEDHSFSHEYTLSLKNELKLAHHIQRNFSHKATERSSISVTSKTSFSRMEKVIYYVDDYKNIQRLNISTLSFTLICSLLLLIFYYKTSLNFDLIKANISVLFISSLRLFKAIEINKGARVLSCYFDGLITDYRYAFVGIFNTRFLYLSQIQRVAQELNTFNNMVRSALEQVEFILMQHFYSTSIPVVEIGSQSIINISNGFDLSTTLAIRANNLGMTPLQQINQQNNDMNFILNNTLNGLLGANGKITDILLDDNIFKFQYLTNFMLYSSIACALVGLILYLFLIYHYSKEIERRNKLINMFLWLSESEINKSLKPVKFFESYLSKAEFELNTVTMSVFQGHAKPTDSNKIAKKHGSRKKEIDMTHINLRLLRILLRILISIFVVLIPFIYLTSTIRLKSKQIKADIHSIVKVNRNLYDLTIIASTIYEYVQYNSTTEVLFEPIGKQWEETYYRISMTSDFWIELQDDIRADESSELQALLTHDLCEVLNLTSVFCGFYKRAAINQGVIGLNSFVLLTMRTVKDMFDTSDRSHASAKAALSYGDFVNVEFLHDLIELPVYQRIAEILEEKVKDSLSKVVKSIKSTVIIVLIAYLFQGCFSVLIISRNIREEHAKWKKMLRKIPLDLIRSNKTLMNYIGREYDQIFTSASK